MQVKTLPLSGLLLVEPKIYRDCRGFFTERFKESVMHEMGIREKFVQDNHSRSGPRVLRGMHFQTSPRQGKLVSVIRGRIWDVAVDIRKDSPTFGRFYGVELNDQNGQMLWVPYGFAHGFCVLGDEDTDVVYKVTGEFNAATEYGVAWNDPAIGISWPIDNPIVSVKDQKLPTLSALNPIVI